VMAARAVSGLADPAAPVEPAEQPVIKATAPAHRATAATLR
jgi:hypothetical protein